MPNHDSLSRSSVQDLLCKLISIPSVNPTVAPEEPYGEKTIAEFAHSWLQAHSVTARLEEAAPGRPNVYAEVGSGNGPTLCLCAHLDTVGTSGMTISPFEPRVAGNKVYGRGSYDMKGGVAAIMSAAAVIAADSNIRGKLILALVVDEEYASIGADDFVKKHKADACILVEPSEQKIILGHKGFVWAEITTKGRAAHGSRWDIGVSAIGKMSRIIVAFEEFDRRVLRKRVHPLVGPASMHCALIQGGSGISTYAPECTLKVERRTIPGEKPEDAVRELEEVIRSAGEEVDVNCSFHRPSLLCDRDEPVVRHLRAAAQSVTGVQPEEAGVAFWMDAAVFAEAGIPTVNYGSSGAGAHEAVEWVDLDSVVSVAQVMVETTRRFCK
ncbi:ArgE/DapE family deacylase [Candidatus Acetothermia bacterium]|nr:ArgE/DapE family deacylase [Candidatus Acetothermia bacterium]MBI3460700.1 ArgE/DapE family deacylase [Candidatus Acetothermia bacterium]MBI3660349.1 ArgE/DapE family deacylase [Candidatus Acetothermia bacterium]